MLIDEPRSFRQSERTALIDKYTNLVKVGMDFLKVSLQELEKLGPIYEM